MDLWIYKSRPSNSLMVCPLCGRKSEVGLFCSECYLKKNLKVELPGVIELTRCKGCNAFLLGGRWVKSMTEEDAIMRATQAALKTNVKRLEKTGAISIEAEKAQKGYDATVTIGLGESEIKKRARVDIKTVACPDCSRKAGGYFEAVLQLRGAVGKRTVEQIIENVRKHKDRFSFVADVKRVRGGYDIYLGSKKSAEKIVREYRGKAETKKSFEQVGLDRQSGKSRNRFFYLIRL